MIVRKYVSEFGKWYVQVDSPSRMELSFDYDPTDAEVEAVLDSMKVEEQVELVAENGEII